MYKLLIVDDECKIREGIAKAIDWNALEVEIVGTAVNGSEALKMVDNLYPEIIISDIRMDIMDGLELCAVLKEQSPFIKIVLLTGYDEFEYAKKAVELNVFSYLLKPVLPDELKNTILKVIDKIKDEKKLEQKIKNLDFIFKENITILRDRFLNELIINDIIDNKKTSQNAQMLGMNFDKQYYRCVIFSIDNSFDLINSNVKEYHLFLHAIIEVVASTFSDNQDYSIFVTIKDYDVICLLGIDSSKETKKQYELLKILEFIKSKVKIVLGFTVSILLGNCYDIAEISKSYREASICKEYKATVGEDSIIEIKNVWSLIGKKYFYPYEKQNEIILALNKSEEELQNKVKSFFSYLAEQKYIKSQLNMAVIQFISFLMSISIEKGLNLFDHYSLDIINLFAKSEVYENLDELEKRVWKIVKNTKTLLEKDQQNCINTVINSSIDYIHNNFSNSDLSLESISEKFYMTPNYFSRLFKKETGESYKTFITNIRIEKAKKYLKSSNMRIIDLCKATGYINSQYFCTAFKNVVGLTPKEYRERG